MFCSRVRVIRGGRLGQPEEEKPGLEIVNKECDGETVLSAGLRKGLNRTQGVGLIQIISGLRIRVLVNENA